MAKEKSFSNGSKSGLAFERAERLLRVARDLNLQEAGWEQDGTRLALRRLPLAAGPSAAEAEESAAVVPDVAVNKAVLSPRVGIFWRGGGKGKNPFVVEGDRVKTGQRLAVVEAMQTLTDVVSPFSGTVAAVLMGDGKPVDYGKKLFEIKEDD